MNENHHNEEINLKELAACIKHKRQSEELSLREVEELTGVSYPTLSRIENGVTTPEVPTLKRLCQWLQLPYERFLGRATANSNVATVFSLAPNTALNRPYFDSRVPAGFPSPAESHYDERLDLNEHLIRHPLATFFVRVAGDSMIGERIFHGDLLVVDRAEEVRNGHIVIAAVNGEFCVKRYDNTGATVVLRSANPAYPHIELTPDDDWAIWGRVLHSIHRH